MSVPAPLRAFTATQAHVSAPLRAFPATQAHVPAPLRAFPANTGRARPRRRWSCQWLRLWALAAHDPARRGARPGPFAVGLFAGDERVAVPAGALHEAPAAGREVMDHLRGPDGEAVPLDDVEVGPEPRGEDT